MRVRTALLVGLIVALCPSLGAAQDDENPYTRSGFYLGASVAYIVSNFGGELRIQEIPGFSLSPDMDSAWGVNARVGYRITPIFSAELGGEYASALPYQPPGPDVDVSIWNLSLSIKGNADLSGVATWLRRVQPYGLLGAGFYQASYSGLAWAKPPSTHYDGLALFGIGTDFYVTDHIVVALEGRYNLVMQNETVRTTDPGTGDTFVHQQRGLDYISLNLGMQYRF